MPSSRQQTLLLSLPPAPAGYCSIQDNFIGVWSSIPLRVEQAGVAFYQKYEVVQYIGGESAPSTSSPAASTPTDSKQPSCLSADESGEVQRKKKGLKDGSITGKVKEAIESELDLYNLLCASPASSMDELKKNYRKLALVYHPDKRSKSGSQVLNRTESIPDLKNWDIPNPAKMTDEQIKQHFIAIQTAFEILSDEVCRKQYDSSLPFDEALPTAADITSANFYQVCGPAFAKEAKWSVRKPVPQLGDENTPIEQVKRFYRFWTDFESWRDFSQYGEHKLEEAESRDERRWMQKENWRIVSKYVKQERQRVHQFVCLAESKDPRIIADREAEYRRKEEAKAARLAAQREAQLKATLSQRKEEEERKAKEEAEAKLAAQKKQAEKKLIQDLRKRIRKYYKNQCQENNFICEFTTEDLTEFCQTAPQEWLSTMLARIESGLRSVESDDLKPEMTAKTIRAVMSEWNSTRYKSDLPAKSAPKVEVEAKKQRVWSAEELSALSKALVRFPGGTPNRWQQIATFVGGGITAEEAIDQAKSLSTAKPVISQDPFELSQKRIGEDKKRIAAPADKRDPSTVPEWTADEQQALEKALAKYPASMGASERWSLIASEVPGKTPKECVARFKEIRDAIMAAATAKKH